MAVIPPANTANSPTGSFIPALAKIPAPLVITSLIFPASAKVKLTEDLGVSVAAVFAASCAAAFC